MKSFKIIFVGAVIAGLLFVSANSAMAAYTGLYEKTAGSSPVNWVTLNNGSFEFSGKTYTVDDLGNDVWRATASSNGDTDYIYGGYRDGKFAFIQSGSLLDPSLFDNLTTKIDGFITAVENDFIINASWATPEMKLASLLVLGTTHFGNLAAPILSSEWFGFGEFAADGKSFDVTVGDLSPEGLQAMLCDDCTNTYAATPIPAAIWLLGSGLVGLVGLRRRMRG